MAASKEESIEPFDSPSSRVESTSGVNGTQLGQIDLM